MVALSGQSAHVQPPALKQHSSGCPRSSAEAGGEGKGTATQNTLKESRFHHSVNSKAKLLIKVIVLLEMASAFSVFIDYKPHISSYFSQTAN